MKTSMVIFLLFASTTLYGQLGVSYHQSSLPFVGINYEIKERFMPELRISTDSWLYDVTIGGVLTYQIINKSDFEFYGGLGIRANSYGGFFEFPIGLHIFPLTNKQFGFHIELAPLIETDVILRGSWGIRYRFRKE